MGTMPEGPKMYDFIKKEMCLYIYDLVPNIPIVNVFTPVAVRPNLNITDWQKIGYRNINYVPCAEYLKAKK
jgi:hypothetical protein